ncbi:MAG: Zn-dependent alcohol dehydrogenase [Myxococcales bacterium]|nr:Zn-dependent alcohol dehydrogenase [Myxococcales bacterium]
MKAAVLEKAGEPLRILEDVEIADPAPGQVRVAVSHCGICHSDLSIVDGSFPATTLPVILGHEAAGVVEAVGPGVESHRAGDKVVLSPCPPCGLCYYCVRGEAALCVQTISIQTNAFPDGSTGLSRKGERVFRGFGVAGFAERVLTQASGAVVVDADVPLETACVIGCAVQTGVGAVLNTAKVTPGATVLVMGLGGIGLSIVQGARIAGASRILVSDPVAARRESAARFGATDCIDPESEDVVSRCYEITGVGVDCAFDAVGRSVLVHTGIGACRNGGTTVIVGAIPIDDPVTLSPAALFGVQEKKLIGCVLGSCNSLYEIPRLVALWKAGRLDLESMITARRPLEEINEGMADVAAAQGIRTVLTI